MGEPGSTLVGRADAGIICTAMFRALGKEGGHSCSFFTWSPASKASEARKAVFLSSVPKKVRTTLLPWLQKFFVHKGAIFFFKKLVPIFVWIQEGKDYALSWLRTERCLVHARQAVFTAELRPGSLLPASWWCLQNDLQGRPRHGPRQAVQPCGFTFPVMNICRATTPVLERERQTYPDNFLNPDFYLLRMNMVQRKKNSWKREGPGKPGYFSLNCHVFHGFGQIL